MPDADNPLEDELGARRGGGVDPDAEDKDSESVDERAANGDADEEDDGQFAFVVEEQGRKVTMGTLIARGTPIEYKVNMGGKSIGARGGLLDPTDTNILLLVRGVVSNVDTKFTRDSDDKITKATIYVHIAPRSVVNAKSEAADVLLHGEPGEAAAA